MIGSASSSSSSSPPPLLLHPSDGVLVVKRAGLLRPTACVLTDWGVWHSLCVCGCVCTPRDPPPLCCCCCFAAWSTRAPLVAALRSDWIADQEGGRGGGVKQNSCTIMHNLLTARFKIQELYCHIHVQDLHCDEKNVVQQSCTIYRLQHSRFKKLNCHIHEQDLH